MKTVIVGGGQAGHFCAVSLRKIAPAEGILIISDEADAPYDRPEITKRPLLGGSSAPKHLLQKGTYAELEIGLVLDAPVVHVDYDQRRIYLADGRGIAFDRLVLATGSRRREIDVPGSNHIHYLRNWSDRTELEGRLQGAGRVALVGGGILNLELAALLRTRGVGTIVIEGAASILERLAPPDFCAWLEARHRHEGVEFRYGTTLAGVVESGRQLAANLTDGSVEYVDAIVASIGVTQCVDLADHELKTRRGILVDETGATNRDGVFAAGEVAEYWDPLRKQHLLSETWNHAVAHGTHVANTLAATPSAYVHVERWWSEQYGLYIQGVGHFDRQALLLDRPDILDDGISRIYRDAESQQGYSIFVGNQREASKYYRSLKAEADRQVRSISS